MANFYKDNQDLKFQLSNPLMERIVELKENNYADYGKYDYAPKDLKDAIESDKSAPAANAAKDGKDSGPVKS